MAGLGNFNFSDIKKLSRDLKRMQIDFPAFLEECIRELAARLLAKVIARTPVDSGELRRSWTIGQIERTATGYEVEIINPVEYSLYVEYGHRTRDHKGWVNGQFMLSISEDEINRELPAFMNGKLQQFIDRHMR